ncbi:MAG: hypothetical protein AAGI53_15100 [Planctomycetota bacterium]
MIVRRLTALSLALGASLLAACSSSPKTELGLIYNEAASAEEEFRSPVIVIPGILGSKLIDTESGTQVWGAFTGDFANPTKPDGARLIALPMEEGVPLADLTDEVWSDGALDTVEIKLFGIPVELSAYFEILSSLGVGGYRDRQLGESGAIQYGAGHYTCDQFDYDWRKDVSQHAADLHEFVTSVSEYVAEERGLDEPVKVDIVAHSMGGLVARYYLRYGPTPLPDDGSLPPVTWEGAKYVKRLIMVGTPNAGSVLSLTQLIEGYKIAPILPDYNSAILGTFPSIYQLLPRVRHGAYVLRNDPETRVDVFDAQQWIDRGWGLANPKNDKDLKELLPETSSPAERRAIALDQLRKSLARAKQFHRAMDQPATPPDGLDIVLIAGDAEDTPAVASIDKTGRVRITEDVPGDGTVARYSALMDERTGREWEPGVVSPIDFEQVIFLANNHLGLTKDPNFTNNVLFLLLERQRESMVSP